MNLPKISPEAIIAGVALVTAVINYFRVNSVVSQVRDELQTELTAFKTSLAADATLAAASVLADALIAGAKLKSDAKLAKDGERKSVNR